MVVTGYNGLKHSLMVQLDDGEAVEICLFDYIDKGNRVPLIGLTSNTRVVFSNNLVSLVNETISKMTGIPKFTREKYRRMLLDARKLIRDNRKNFNGYSGCTEYAFKRLGVDLNRLTSTIMTTKEYLKLMDIAIK